MNSPMLFAAASFFPRRSRSEDPLVGAVAMKTLGAIVRKGSAACLLGVSPTMFLATRQEHVFPAELAPTLGAK
jgi:hypothetical protein